MLAPRVRAIRAPSGSMPRFRGVALDLFTLAGRVALVTGGNGGLGRAIALALRSFGADVAVTGRNPDKNAAVAAEVGEEAVFELEVRDEGMVERTVDLVVERLGGLDILVNNAGTGREGG